jgi:hypothetical protein
MLEEKKTHPTFEISKQKHTQIEVMNLPLFYSFFTLPFPPPKIKHHLHIQKIEIDITF